MSEALASRTGWRSRSPRLLAFRALCAFGVLCTAHVAAQLLQEPHSGVTAALVGIPLALLTAAGVRAAPASFQSCAARPRLAVAPHPVLLLTGCLALGLVVLWPALSAWLMPFDDSINHLARIYVMVHGAADPLLSRFYAIEWHVLPNLGLELTLPWLVAATDIYTAGKLFTVATLALMLAGPFAVHRALYRQWSLGPLVAAVFLYNGVTRYGMLNYQLGIGLMLLAIASWIALRSHGAAVRSAMSLVCVLVLFACHLMALAVYGLTIFSYELWLACVVWRAHRRRWTDLAVLVLPFVPMLVLMALGPARDEAIDPRGVVWGGLHARLDGLRYLVLSYAPRWDLLALIAILAGLLWAIRKRRVFMHPFGWVLLAVVLPVYLVIPNEAMGTSGAAVRMPVAVMFVLFGVLRWNLPDATAQRAFLLAVTALAVFRLAPVEAVVRQYNAIADDVRASLPLIQPGSRVLIAADYSRREEALQSIQELPMLALIERSSLVSIAYSHPQQQILVVRPPYRAMTGGYSDQPVALPDLLKHTLPDPDAQPLYDPSGRLYWADWERNYDYVFLIYRSRQPNPAPDRLALLRDGDHFQLFRVIHPH
mgnify:CR=1 FL=1